MASSEIQESKSRRSGRQKAMHRGFKGSSCFNKNCLGCTMDPPPISPSFIKNLGQYFCKINLEKLKEQELNKTAASRGKKQQFKKERKRFQ
jgi:hypothetical protein